MWSVRPGSGVWSVRLGEWVSGVCGKRSVCGV